MSAKKSGKVKKEKPQMSTLAKRIDNHSFLALLIRSFVSFMLITVLAVVVIFSIAIWANNKGRIQLATRSFGTYANLLSEGKYANFPCARLLGTGGWLCIVDENGDYVYSSDNEVRSYTKSELEFISDINDSDVITVRSFKNSNGESSHLISRSFWDWETSEFVEQYLLLDEDLNIISGSIATVSNRTKFTQKEFDLYTYNSSHSGTLLQKYYFTRGEERFYAIMLDCDINDGVTPYFFVALLIVATIGLLTASLILYIRYINKHVTKPLNSLGTAMEQFTANNYREPLEYVGIKELEQLVDNFNEMSVLLKTSENQRDLLEKDRQRMLAGLSHDLKTPMTVIQGFSKAIVDGLVTGEEAEKYLKIILDKSEHMSALINEFYEYSKLDHPDFKLSTEKVDVAELVRTYIAERYEEFEVRGGNFDVDIIEERLFCNIDKDRLERVFDNLVSNYFKYTPAGSRLYVRLMRKDENALIIFADDGNGIPSEVAADIFTPFVVGEASRNKQGSGLGLAVCQKIVSAHGGSITLNTSPFGDWNTQFDILLPLAPIETEAVEEKINDENPA